MVRRGLLKFVCLLILPKYGMKITKFFSILILLVFTCQTGWGQTPTIKATLTNEEKLFGLAKLWSEAKYNFANFDLTKINWDSTYKVFIPKILATNTDEAYFKTLMQMMALLKDGHSNVYYKPFFDYKKPPIKTKLIAGKVIVVEIYNDTLLTVNKLAVGDEILEVNRMNVIDFGKTSIAPYQSASTVQDLDMRVYTYGLLVGKPDEAVEVKIKKQDGAVFSTSLSRKMTSNYKKQTYLLTITKENIAHLKINDFENADYQSLFDAIYPKILPTKALIIDVRENGGGDDGQGNYVLSHLIDKTTYSSKSKTRNHVPTFKAWGQAEMWTEFEPDVIKPVEGKEKFLKPLVLLTGAKTYSAAEDFAVAYDNAGRGIKMGQTTGGSTGQPLFFDLPDGNFARICTKKDYYPNGKQFVGIGIVPDVEVLETIQNIRDKRDAVLEKAVEYILTKF